MSKAVSCSERSNNQRTAKRIYASGAFPESSAIGELDFVQISTVGGTIFSPLSILRFGALLDASVDETAAEI